MGLRVRGLSEVLKNMRRTEAKVLKGSLDALRKAAKEVVALTKKMVPVDTFALDKAVSSEELRERTSLGRFGQVTISVGVDMSKLDLSLHNGFDYAVEMHEGTYNLGPKSVIKQAGQPEQVGPKYLERALKQLRDKITKDMAEATRRAAK